MNIFVVDRDPVKAAQSLADVHVVKMLLESVQLLCTYLNEKGYETPYKSTHKNHPCQLWLKETPVNLRWLCFHTLELCREYRYRFAKQHKCEIVLDNIAEHFSVWHLVNPIKYNINFTLCMPDEYKTSDPIESYRNYYRSKKHTMKRAMKWTNREQPNWMENYA